jgi:hypothetical protein
VFGEGNQLLKFTQKTAFQRQLPGSGTRRRRDRGSSHHGELAALCPRTPDPGTGGREARRGAPTLGTLPGPGWRRWTRESARRELRFPCFRPPGSWGRGIEGARKSFLASHFRSRQTFVAEFLWLPAVGSQSVGASVSRGTAVGGGVPFLLLLGRWESPSPAPHGSLALCSARSCPPGIASPRPGALAKELRPAQRQAGTQVRRAPGGDLVPAGATRPGPAGHAGRAPPRRAPPVPRARWVTSLVPGDRDSQDCTQEVLKTCSFSFGNVCHWLFSLSNPLVTFRYLLSPSQ